jgi:hypothetical protein
MVAPLIHITNSHSSSVPAKSSRSFFISYIRSSQTLDLGVFSSLKCLRMQRIAIQTVSRRSAHVSQFWWQRAGIPCRFCAGHKLLPRMAYSAEFWCVFCY